MIKAQDHNCHFACESPSLKCWRVVVFLKNLWSSANCLQHMQVSKLGCLAWVWHPCFNYSLAFFCFVCMGAWGKKESGKHTIVLLLQIVGILLSSCKSLMIGLCLHPATIFCCSSSGYPLPKSCSVSICKASETNSTYRNLTFQSILPLTWVKAWSIVQWLHDIKTFNSALLRWYRRK